MHASMPDAIKALGEAASNDGFAVRFEKRAVSGFLVSSNEAVRHFQISAVNDGSKSASDQTELTAMEGR